MHWSHTKRALVGAAVFVPLAGCGSAGSDDPVTAVGSCASFALEYVATQKLSVPELDEAGWRIVSAASGENEIRVLLEQRATGTNVPPKLVRYAAATKERLGDVQLALTGCTPLALTHASSSWLALADCSGASGQEHTVFTLAEDGSASTSFGFLEPHAVRLAFDETGGRYWIWGFDGVFSASATTAPAFDSASLEPLGWGPTSGFDHVGSTLVFARDASEAGMSNMLALQRDTGGERCKFDIENAPGLTGQRQVLAFGDASTLFALAPRGDLAEFRVSVTGVPGA